MWWFFSLTLCWFTVSAIKWCLSVSSIATTFRTRLRCCLEARPSVSLTDATMLRDWRWCCSECFWWIVGTESFDDAFVVMNKLFEYTAAFVCFFEFCWWRSCFIKITTSHIKQQRAQCLCICSPMDNGVMRDTSDRVPHATSPCSVSWCEMRVTEIYDQTSQCLKFRAQRRVDEKQRVKFKLNSSFFSCVCVSVLRCALQCAPVAWACILLFVTTCCVYH